MGSAAVNRMLYDSRGFLWIGTRDGLSRFDGYRFSNYKIGKGAAVSSPGILQIVERKNGDYLIADQSNDIYRFNAQTIVTESGLDGSLTLNAERILTNREGELVEDSEGVLWIGGFQGLSRINEGGGKFELAPALRITVPGGEVARVTRYREDRARTWWLSTERGLVHIDKTGRVLAFYQTPLPSGLRSYLNHLYLTREGRVWVFSQAGLFVLQPDLADISGAMLVRPLTANIKHRLPVNPGEIVNFGPADGFTGKVVPALHETADGRICLASDEGLLIYEGAGFRRFNAENGIGEYLTDISEDSNGDLWLGSFSGVFKLTLNGFTSFAQADGLGRADVAAIYQNSAGDVFAAEGDWFVSHFDGHRFISAQPRLPEDRGPPPWTSNISFLDSHDSWWFLTEKQLARHDGVQRIEDLPARSPSATFATGDEFNQGAFYRLFEDSRGNVWISTRSAIPENVGLSLWIRGENRIREFGAAENFPVKMAASSFCEDARGNIWIGFYNGGLARYDGRTFTVFGAGDGLPNGYVSSLLLDPAGRIWVGTGESGLTVVDDPAAEKPAFRNIPGLASNNVRALTQDNFGRIYAGTVRGIDRISPDTGQVMHISTLDGLADDFVTVAFREKNGTLWFGTRNGVSRFVPSVDKPAKAPPILIAGLRVAGEKQPVSELGASEVGKLELKSAQNNLQIDFFSVGVASPELVRYQVMLEGADRDWGKPTAERTVNYSNLAPGSYRFMVRAINAQGLASQTPATVVFRIAPPLWKTWWFVTLIALMVVGAVYFLLNQRFKRVLELEKVRTRIATDLHDDIGASLSRISMLSEMVNHQNGASSPESAKRLTQIAADARGLVDSMSDIVWAINPRRDSVQSVVDRVCSFAADTLGTKQVHWTVTSPPALKSLHLTAEEKRNLYLIFKEAINNSARHSGCQNASLRIRIDRGNLIAEVMDDGKGFSATETVNRNSRGGNGIDNMRARAQEIGGELQFESNADTGTKIILTLPLRTYRMYGWFRRPRK